jgi:hypothetical protein
MSDETTVESVSELAEPGQSGERPRKSRKRGKRNRTRSAESAAQALPEAQTEGQQAAPEPQPAPRERERERERPNRRSATGRGSQHGFGDGLDRYYCVAGLRLFPREWPVSNRKGLAVAIMLDVDRRGNDVLLCDRLHDGPCQWADGVPVDESGDSAVVTSAVQTTTPVTQVAASDSAREFDVDA